MAPSKAAALALNEMINDDRKRRKNTALAQEIFSKNRRSSALGTSSNNTRKPVGNRVPSLASRIGTPGISKRTASTSVNPKKARATPPGNVDAEWTHDLHSTNNPSAAKTTFRPPRGPKALEDRRQERLEYALNGSRSSPALNNQFNIVGVSKPAPAMTIRGLAGPYAVIAKNLAVGTTAADIESAMTPSGGIVLSCRMIVEKPKVIAEVIFETKEGADNVVETFNNAMADGNILQVYHKVSPVTPVGPRADATNTCSDGSRSGYGGISDRYPPRDRSRERERERERERGRSYGRDGVVDGTYGFSDKMDADEPSGLYSDCLVASRGRGVANNRDGGDRGNDGSRSYR